MPDELAMTLPLLQNPLKFLQPKENSSISANLQFVLWLEPPVYVTDTVAKNLAGFFFNRTEKYDPQSLSLEQLLIEEAVPSIKFSANRDINSDVRWEKKFDDSSYLQVYSYDTKSFTNAKKILLRQQLIYNALFQSCFNSSTYKPLSKSNQPFQTSSLDIQSDESDDSQLKTIKIHVQTTDPPNSLSVTFQVPEISASISLQISNIQDSQPFVLSQILWKEEKGGGEGNKEYDPNNNQINNQNNHIKINDNLLTK
ncbi:5672_t:CDS:2 [Diversispora eburnea]|uniref:5672_t:CDS:1 n=1 Tax=Diversispora eburnea TaxID=1213867 RepID=A0A9N8YLM8_9GLOM|nr:5672_t:CDS:2 [Diversispora eburnea]